MQYILIIICLLSVNAALHSQTIEQKVANEICACLGNQLEKEEVDGRIGKCIPISLEKMLEEGTEQERKSLSTVGDVQRAIYRAEELLEMSCPVVRKAALENKKNIFYTPSSSHKANQYYLEGNVFVAEESFAKAARRFKRAIKEDENFVLAIDHLAMCYRSMKAYDKAILWYERSLAVFPEGDVALLNIAVAYSLKKDPDKSLEYYHRLNQLYPENPEGFYGIAKISLLTGRFEQALENALLAHKMYVTAASAYAADSQELINVLYHKFNELNQHDVFLAETEKHGVELSLNEK